MEFANPHHMDRFLALADKIKTTSRGMITIKRDDTAVSNIKAKDAMVQ